MITSIKHFFGIGNSKVEKNDFSTFFREASSGEQKKVLMKVIRKANEKQREIMESSKKARII